MSELLRKNSLVDVSSAAGSEVNVYEVGVLCGEYRQQGGPRKKVGNYPESIYFPQTNNMVLRCLITELKQAVEDK
jgi:hypothetical protein